MADEEIARRLREARAKRGFPSAREAARDLGWNENTYKSHENAMRGVPLDEMKKYASAFRVSPEWLAFGRDGQKPLLARLVGYVGAGGAIYPFSDDVEWIEAPPGAPEGLEALEIKNASMIPAYRDGDRIFIEPNDHTPDQLVGREVVVDIDDGKRLLKVLRRGTEPGRWTLESFNAEPIENVVVTKIAPVGWVDKRRRN
jgi:phage repressor protein C with HTH and peptisase S24 domain